MIGGRYISDEIAEENNPAEIHNLGKQVGHFDESRWKAYRGEVIFEATKQKIAQDTAGECGSYCFPLKDATLPRQTVTEPTHLERHLCAPEITLCLWQFAMPVVPCNGDACSISSAEAGGTGEVGKINAIPMKPIHSTSNPTDDAIHSDVDVALADAGVAAGEDKSKDHEAWKMPEEPDWEASETWATETRNNVSFLKYEMKGFMMQCIERYIELAGGLYKCALRKAETPFLDESGVEFCDKIEERSTGRSPVPC
jgi:hypothetical protein